jgi:hypothetical protein
MRKCGGICLSSEVDVVTEIIVSIVGAIATILAVVLNAKQSRTDMINQLQLQQERADAKMQQAQAVTDTKLEELTREVREHNGFAKRLPVIEEQIKVINHRIDDLERGA